MSLVLPLVVGTRDRMQGHAPQICRDVMANIPDLLHYQPFHEARLRQLIIERRVYMSSPAAFNDPWDCHPHFDTRLVSAANYRERLANYFEELVRRRPRSVPLEQLQQQIEELRRSPDAALKQVMRQSEGIQKGLTEQWRLYCLTPYADNELMWSHYGDSHRGIALQYHGCGPWAQHASRVDYLKDYPSIDILDTVESARQILLSKSAAWSYEHEYRVLAWEGEFAPSGIEIPVTDGNFATLPDDSLSSIVLGALASGDTEKAVLAMVDESGLDLVVQRAVLLPDRYGLTFRRLR